MQYRPLGKSGVKVSVIGLGCNRIGRTVDLASTRAIIARALDLGINFLDTADVYGSTPGASELVLGEALTGLWDRIVLGTKVRSKMGDGVNDLGASRYHIMSGVEGTLRRLKTDHIDLYYIHSWDETVPIQETMRALQDLVTSGKVRYIGASNFTSWQLAHSNDVAEMRGWNQFVVTQEEYHMLQRDLERDVIPYARYANLGIVPYFPLAGGLLTGKYNRGDAVSATRTNYITPFLTEENFQILDHLRAFVARRDRTMTDLATAWLLGEPQVCSVISGATTAEQVSLNAKASDWVLTPDELQEVNEILKA